MPNNPVNKIENRKISESIPIVVKRKSHRKYEAPAPPVLLNNSSIFKRR